MALDAAAVPDILRLAADPLRWRLLAALARSDLRVRELVEAIEQPQNLVSYHLRVLREGGLISATRSTHDGRETYYHLDLGRYAADLATAGAALHPALAPPRRPGRASSPQTMSVLFICTGNSARSPLAEAMLRSRAGAGWRVASAGSHPKADFHPLAVTTLRDDFGLRPSAPRPRAWSTMTDQQFDVVISLCDKAREAWARGADRPRTAHWSIPDPAAIGGPRGSRRAFQHAAHDIHARVGHLIDALADRR